MFFSADFIISYCSITEADKDMKKIEMIFNINTWKRNDGVEVRNETPHEEEAISKIREAHMKKRR